MIESLKEIRYGFAYALGILIVMVLQAVGLWRVRRCRRRQTMPPLVLQLLVSLGGFAIPVLAGVVVHLARSDLLRAFSSPDGSVKAAGFSAGISGQLNAIPFAASAMMISGPLWIFGLEELVAARGGVPVGEGRFSPASLICLGLWTLLVGVLRWSIHFIKAFAGLAALDPDDKVTRLSSALDFAQEHLRTFVTASAVTIVGFVVVAMVLVVSDRRRETTPAGPSRNDSRRTVAPPFKLSLSIFVAAVALTVIARPLRSENETGWPPPLPGDDLRVTTPATPRLEGPDRIERAPVVQVFPAFVALDGAQHDLDDLGAMLGTLRTNVRLLRPQDPFRARVIVVAAAETTTRRLVEVLRVIHDADYPEVTFAFTRLEKLVRPTLGTLERVWSTGIEALVVNANDDQDDEPEDGERLRARAFATYDQLARAMLAARGRGRRVILRIDP